MRSSYPFFALSTVVSSVYAHSHVTNLVIDGAAYEGYAPQMVNPEILGAWSTDVHQDGWIGFGSYHVDDIICHINASNAKGYVPVSAGDTMSIQWMGWPESHHGPVLTYLARCGADATSCAHVNKADLEFFSIDRAGLLDPTRNATEHATARGVWATDVLIAANNTWAVRVPERLAPGFYVLRHELVALHYATNPGLGPQHYPQCWNLQITGNGTQRPRGVPGVELYDLKRQSGLTYDIYRKELPPYPIPGPEVMEGVGERAAQTGWGATGVGVAVPAETGA